MKYCVGNKKKLQAQKKTCRGSFKERESADSEKGGFYGKRLSSFRAPNETGIPAILKKSEDPAEYNAQEMRTGKEYFRMSSMLFPGAIPIFFRIRIFFQSFLHRIFLQMHDLSNISLRKLHFHHTAIPQILLIQCRILILQTFCKIQEDTVGILEYYFPVLILEHYILLGLRIFNHRNTSFIQALKELNL